MQDILSMSNDLEALRRLSQVSIGGRSPVAFLCQCQRRPGKERGRRLSFLPRGPPSFPAPPSPHLQRAGSAPRREPGRGGVRRHSPSDRRRQAPRATQHARARRVPSTQGRDCDLSPRPKMRPVQKKKKKKSVMTCCGIQDPVSQNPTLRPTGSQKAFSNRTRLAALTQIAPSFFFF